MVRSLERDWPLEVMWAHSNRSGSSGQGHFPCVLTSFRCLRGPFISSRVGPTRTSGSEDLQPCMFLSLAPARWEAESILLAHLFLPRLILGNAKALFSLCSLGGGKYNLGKAIRWILPWSPRPRDHFLGSCPLVGTAL